MAEDRELDPDRTDDTLLEDDDDVVGIGESDDEFDDSDDESLDEEPSGMMPTEEVGSEGGSPGEAMGRGRSGAGGSAGTEATELWPPSDDDRQLTDRRDDEGVPVRRSPS